MEELYAEGLAGPWRPRVMRRCPVRAWRSVGRGMRRPGDRAAKSTFRGADAVDGAEGNTAGGVIREPLAGPARSKSQGMCRTSMRENRESPCPPAGVVSGWAAQGTLRR